MTQKFKSHPYSGSDMLSLDIACNVFSAPIGYSIPFFTQTKPDAYVKFFNKNGKFQLNLKKEMSH